MVEPKIVPCRYFFKDGYCTKGQYCVFSHDSEITGHNRRQSKAVCKFYHTEKGCQYGKACTFQHVHPQKAAQVITKCRHHTSKPPSPPPPLPPTRQTSNDSVVVNHTDTDELWGLQDNQSSNPDGVYYYGAYTSNTTVDKSSHIPTTKKFTDLFTVSDEKHDTQSKYSNKDNHKISVPQQVCSFYVAGNCRYGTSCHHIHSILPLSIADTDEDTKKEDDGNASLEHTSGHRASPTENKNEIGDPQGEIIYASESELSLLQREVAAARKAECGICLEQIGSGMYESVWQAWGASLVARVSAHIFSQDTYSLTDMHVYHTETDIDRHRDGHRDRHRHKH